MDEVDESATGSANLWSGPGQPGPGLFCGHARMSVLRPRPIDSDHRVVEPEDVRLLFEVLFDIRHGVHQTLVLLEGDDDGEEEEDA